MSRILRFLAVGPEVFVEIDLERVVEQIGGHHEAAKGGQRHDLVGIKGTSQAIEQLVTNTIGHPGKLAAILDDETFPLIEAKVVGVVSGVDQKPAEEGRADKAVRSCRDRMGEQNRCPFSQERSDFFAKVVPGHQRT